MADQYYSKDARDSFDATASLLSPESVGQMHPEGFRRRQEIFWPRFLKTVIRNATVIDIGCGAGSFTAAMEKNGYCAVGIDFSFVALREAKKRQGHIQLVCADISQIPFQSNLADAVLVFGVMEFVTDRDKALSEIHRILKPSGKVFLIMLSSHSLHHRLGLPQAAAGHPSPHRFSPRDECKRLEENGFHVDRLTPIFIMPFPGRPLALLLQALCRLKIRCWPLAHAFMIECKAQ